MQFTLCCNNNVSMFADLVENI